MLICTRLPAVLALCSCALGVRAGCPELNRLPANGDNGQLSCTGGVSPLGVRAADDFFLPAGHGTPYSIRRIRAVMIANFPLTPTTVGITLYEDAVTGSPARPVPGRIAYGNPIVAPTITDIGPFGATSPDGRPFRYYEISYTLPDGLIPLAPGAWYWITPYGIGGPANGAQTDIVYAAIRGPTNIVREPANKSTAITPGAFTIWESTADCCLGGAYDLALYIDASQSNDHATDTNCDGTLSVQDIFDFLNLWFIGSLDADYNGTGDLSVQDIFDYLTAWFAGA